MQFVDEVNIKLKAGNGGNGIVAWRREPNVPMGGPWGGNGGDGGNIILIGDHNINTLFEWRGKKSVSAPNGENGRTQKETGKGGNNVYINLPLGTSVYDANTNTLITDILESGQTYTICEGGKGGNGNAIFKSSFNRAPTLHENGDTGESKQVILKLKYIADVGLVGLPNAGKSTFVGAVSSAKPKVANYQFTTLTPVLGIVERHHQKIVFADLPGLIEGAAEGKGLGHEFLKHIERCAILLHFISLDANDNIDVVKAYKTIEEELSQYSRSLLDKPIIIVANKIDTDSAIKNLAKLKKTIKQKIYTISALKKERIEDLLEQIYKDYISIQKINEINLLKKQQKVKIIELKQQKDFVKELIINKINDYQWEVISGYMKYWTNKIPLDTKDNIVRYNQKMQSLNIEQKAKTLGAKKGDTLLIYGNEMVIDE